MDTIRYADNKKVRPEEWIQYTQDWSDEEAWEVRCPACGYYCLHQQRIEVFDRAEDDTAGVHVVVEDVRATIDTNLVGNPSPRRDGLTVALWGEGCDAKPVLSVIQHKGRTYLFFSTGQDGQAEQTAQQEFYRPLHKYLNVGYTT
jgi:hypothetical protein